MRSTWFGWWALGLSVACAAAVGCGANQKFAPSNIAKAAEVGGDGESNDGASSAADAQADGEVPDAKEAAMAAASIQLPAGTTPEQRRALAKITPEQARAAALARVTGAVKGVDLDDENGALVYSVDILQNGMSKDVKIDAGNGALLFVDVAADTGGESSGN